jgi:hypothetical protein
VIGRRIGDLALERLRADRQGRWAIAPPQKILGPVDQGFKVLDVGSGYTHHASTHYPRSAVARLGAGDGGSSIQAAATVAPAVVAPLEPVDVVDPLDPVVVLEPSVDESAEVSAW